MRATVPLASSEWLLALVFPVALTSALVFAPAGCSSEGADGENGGTSFDLGQVSSQFCSESCQRLVDCAPMEPPQSIVDQCTSSCAANVPSGTARVGAECEPAAQALLDCVSNVGCAVDPTTPVCQSEVTTYGQACQPLPDNGGSIGNGGECNVGPARGPTQSCCPDLGVDACGAGLTCAALGGRTIPVCLPERSQLGGEECTADIQCAGESCNLELEECRTRNGDPCTTELGCAEDADFCYQGEFNSQPICQETDGLAGQPCLDDGQCEEGYSCVDEGDVYSACRAEVGSPCIDDAECPRPTWCRFGPMGAGYCRLGDNGEVCTESFECSSGTCNEVEPNLMLCVGGTGDECSEERDCAGELRCLDGTCGERQAEGGSCDDSDDCLDGLACAGGQCTSGPAGCIPGNEDCPTGSNCQVANQAPIEFECVPEGSAGRNQSCGGVNCADRFICIDFGVGPRCEVPCQDDTDCSGAERCFSVTIGGVSAGFGVCDIP